MVLKLMRIFRGADISWPVFMPKQKWIRKNLRSLANFQSMIQIIMVLLLVVSCGATIKRSIMGVFTNTGL